MCESLVSSLTAESWKFGFNKYWCGNWALSRPTERSSNGFITYLNMFK